MGSADLSQFLWPGPAQGRQPDVAVPKAQDVWSALINSAVVSGFGKPLNPTFTSGATRLGGGYRIPAGGYVTIDNTNSGAISIGQDFTIALSFRTGSSVTNQTLLASSANSPGSRSIRLLIVSSTAIQYLVGDGGGNWADDTITLSPALKVDTDYMLVIRFKKLGYYPVQKDLTIRHKIYQSANANVANYPVAPPSLRFGREASLTGSDFAGLIYGYASYTRYLSDARVMELQDDFWSAVIAVPQILYPWPVAAGGAELAGAAAGGATAGGALTTQITLAGDALAQAAASGSLLTSIVLAGAAAGVATAGGALTTNITLSGAALNVATASGSLTTQIPLAGAALSVATAGGDITAQIRLAGDALAVVTAGGSLEASFELAGNAAGVATAGGTLTTQIRLSADAVAQAQASGSLTVGIPLAGPAYAQALASGALSAQIKLAGAAAGQATAAGALAGDAPLALRFSGSVRHATTLAGTARRAATLSGRVSHV